MSATINTKEFTKAMNRLEVMPRSVMKQLYPYYLSKTPIRGGNARNRTKLSRLGINSNYAYAGRLDEGWSKQSPDGFTAPSEKQLDQLVTNAVKRNTSSISFR